MSTPSMLRICEQSDVPLRCMPSTTTIGRRESAAAGRLPDFRVTIDWPRLEGAFKKSSFLWRKPMPDARPRPRRQRRRMNVGRMPRSWPPDRSARAAAIAAAWRSSKGHRRPRPRGAKANPERRCSLAVSSQIDPQRIEGKGGMKIRIVAQQAGPTGAEMGVLRAIALVGAQARAARGRFTVDETGGRRAERL
jgi:hypothetical protein